MEPERGFEPIGQYKVDFLDEQSSPETSNKPLNQSAVFDQTNISKRKQKRNFKNWLIIILVITLALIWLKPHYSDYVGDFSRITGAFVSNYGETEGVEDGSYFLGAEDAPVKMMMFTEFQCPFSAKFAKETLPQIKEEYIKIGKVKLIIKHLPLDFHTMAESAAWAAMCAGKQERFWDYHDKLFENQKLFSREYFLVLAKELSLDVDDFDYCMRDRRVLRQINLDEQAAAQVRISGTPAFLINGELLVGAQSFSAFKEVIDRKLAE